jgi:hypothetical protein
VKEKLLKFRVVFSFYEGEFLRTKTEKIEATDYTAAVSQVKRKWGKFGRIDVHVFEDVTKKKE